jgi:hypothetical protein
MGRNTIIGITMAPTSRLDFEPCLNSDFDDGCDLGCGFRIGHNRGFGGYILVIRFSIMVLEQCFGRECEEGSVAAKSFADVFD